MAKLAPPLSVTFIPSKLQDNQILMRKDPGYLAKLLALPRVERERLKDGNWNVREDAGTYFKRDYFPIIEPQDLPKELLTVRFWDRAGTSAKEAQENKRNLIEQACTASVKLSLDLRTGMFYIEHITNDMLAPKEVVSTIERVVNQDGMTVTIGLSQDPGQAGKFELEYYKTKFGNWHLWDMKETGSKESRAKPVAARAERGWFKLVRGDWNDEFLTQLENFPDGRKDIIDALSGAFAYFVENKMTELDMHQAVPKSEVDAEAARLQHNKSSSVMEDPFKRHPGRGGAHNNW